MHVQKEIIVPSKKVSFAPGTADNSQVGLNKLIDGAYDEGESHAGFLEALNAWRKCGKPAETPKKSVNKDGKVDIKDVEQSWKQQQDKSKKGSFFANIDAGAKEFNMGSIPTWQEGGTMPDKKLASSKESCWQCYKLYSLDVETSEFQDGAKVSQTTQG